MIGAVDALFVSLHEGEEDEEDEGDEEDDEDEEDERDEEAVDEVDTVSVAGLTPRVGTSSIGGTVPSHG